MFEKTFTLKIAGLAGFGIKSGGQLISKILIDSGYFVTDYNEYPSLVRGGHNAYQITFSREKVFAPHYNVDFFFSINPNHWQTHTDEFTKDSLIFVDEDLKEITEKKGNFLYLPLKELANEVGSLVVSNTICVGVVSYLLNLDSNLSKKLIDKSYQKFSEINLLAFDAGYKYAKDNFSKYKQNITSVKTKQKNTGFYDGNEAFGWGLIKAGINFYAAYPMTPATGTLHFLATKQEEFNIKVIHPEDEISAANMTAGAAFAGARAATGSSGGGFALMNEAISYCGVAEIGMVYYLVSRPGPATGLPTWTAQADLLHAIYSGHGEFPKVVIAPGDLDESFGMGIESLNLAAELQTPIIVVSDKFLGESSSNTKDLSKEKENIKSGEISKKPIQNFKRYDLNTKTGVSPLTIPGTIGGEFLANSYEHNEVGFSTEDPILASEMHQKRMQKLKTALKLTPKPTFFGSDKAKKLIISWGSTKGVILEALKSIKNKDEYAFLQIKTLWPINPDLKVITNSFKEIIVIENNGTSQLTTLLKSQFDFNPTQIITKDNGRPFFPEEIYAKLK
ncbi:MAG: 2-oxoacid:acceptor oxidoreductase subunit alpha [Candidatus Shapirobacteria bacterium]